MHALIFACFQLLPDISGGPENRFVDMIRNLFDSYSKSKLISKAIEISKKSDNDYFFCKFSIALLSTQFNKYLFERFLINSRESNSDCRNYSMAICLFLFSSNLISNYDFNDHQLIATSCIILFMGSYCDSLTKQKTKVRSKKPGQLKLRSNAKT